MGLFDRFRSKEEIKADQASPSSQKQKTRAVRGIQTPGNQFEVNTGLINQYKLYRSDSIIKQQVSMYAELCVNNGFKITSSDHQVQKQIDRRIAEIEFNSNTTMYELIRNQLKHFIAFGNQTIAFARNQQLVSGKPYVYNSKQLDPISGMFITHPITMGIQRNTVGEITSYTQDLSIIQMNYNFLMADPEINFLFSNQTQPNRRFSKYDIAHFKYDEDIITGFGRPFYFEQIDDLLILRKIERTIEELIETGKIMYQIYNVGNDKYPARSQAEVEQVKENIEYSEPYSIIVAPHNHSVEMKSNNVLQDILVFYDKIRHRAYGQLGMSSIMMGEAGQANRATADVSTDFAMLKAKDFQKLFAQQFQHEVLEHLVIDSGFNPKQLGNQMPKLVLNDPSMDAMIKQQNHATFLYEHSVIPFKEVRTMLGLDSNVDEKDMYIYHVKMPVIELQKDLSMPDNQQETENLINPQNQHTNNV